MEAKATVYLADSRNMQEVADESVDLVVTSPPYWHLKDYEAEGQIGYGQTLHDYLIDLSRVWQECFRVLRTGRRLCINIGDQFARSVVYGRYKVIPLHAEVIAQCEAIGFDYMGAIIWQKKTTMRTTGGAVVMGSFPYPPNGIVELDYEYILLFKKPGQSPMRNGISESQKEQSKLTRDEWKDYFSGHWVFGGERQVNHEAMFPEELPRRLIRMFTFVGETVLDPFLGSGTTVKVALELGRNAMGYEIQPKFLPIIREKLGIDVPQLLAPTVSFIERQEPLHPVPAPERYQPNVQNAKPIVDPKQLRFGAEATYRVVSVLDAQTLKMDNGLTVRLVGIYVPEAQTQSALEYLHQYLLGKRVILRFERPPANEGEPIGAYVYLTNRLFVNRKMIEMGLANADRTVMHKFRQKFIGSDASILNRGIVRR